MVKCGIFDIQVLPRGLLLFISVPENGKTIRVNAQEL